MGDQHALPRNANPSIPPAFMPDDLEGYQRRVKDWVKWLVRVAETGDKTFKALKITRARVLALSLPDAQRSVLDAAQNRGELDLYSDQDTAVAKILAIICHETPLQVINRQIHQFSKVMTTKRQPHEDLNRYVDDFWGAASRFLISSDAPTDGPLSTLFSIMMLTNAGLSAESLTLAKGNLVLNAERRIMNSEDKFTVAIPDAVTALRALSATMPGPPPPPRPALLPTVPPPPAPTPATADSAKDISKTVVHAVKSYLGMRQKSGPIQKNNNRSQNRGHGSRDNGQGHQNFNNSGRSYDNRRFNGQGSFRGNCHACGQYGHKRGSQECPETRRDGRRDGGRDGGRGDRPAFFRAEGQ